MPVEFKNYDPTAVVLSIAGIIVGGFAPGSMVTVEANEDTFSLAVGAKGDGTRVRSRNNSGKVTFNIMAESSSNDLLSARLALDRLTGLGYGALVLKYVLGTTIVAAPNAWLVRPANINFDTDVQPREWMIEAHDLEIFGGGSLL